MIEEELKEIFCLPTKDEEGIERLIFLLRDTEYRNSVHIVIENRDGPNKASTKVMGVLLSKRHIAELVTALARVLTKMEYEEERTYKREEEERKW